MKKLLLVLMTVAAFQAQASEESTGATSAVTFSPTIMSLFTTYADEFGRIVVEAKDDAAEFVATNGDVRSAKLQNAFNAIRAKNANLQASDLELAQAILAQ